MHLPGEKRVFSNRGTAEKLYVFKNTTSTEGEFVGVGKSLF